MIKNLGKETIRTRTGKHRCIKFCPVVQTGRIFKKEEDLRSQSSVEKNGKASWIGVRSGWDAVEESQDDPLSVASVESDPKTGENGAGGSGNGELLLSDDPIVLNDPNQQVQSVN